MTNQQILSRYAGWTIIAATLGSVLPLARADALVPQKLDAYVVSAARLPQEPASIASSVSVLSLTELKASQIDNLNTALEQTPGVAITTTGAMGAQSSIFLRGASSHQTQFVVDGIRMNSRSAGYQNFLGGADLAGLERVEVLRGPQSTLYGSSAMGGVIQLDTVRGAGQPSGVISAMGGSFDTWGASAAVQGGTRVLGYSASVGRLETANDRPENRYEQWSFSARLEALVAAPLLIGATVRGQMGDYEEPGSLLYYSPGEVDANNYLVTAYAEWRPANGFTSRLTGGVYRRLYDYAQSWGVSSSSDTRKVVDWQNTWVPTREIELVAGANCEWARNHVGGETTSGDQTAGFASATYKPVAGLAVTAGLRYDDFETFGAATTWRAGVAQVVPGTPLKLRATYGTGFTAPGSDDRYGILQWGQRANPGLVPEKSRGWDAGFDYAFSGGRYNASVTYFHNRFRNLFEWETVNFTTFEGMIVNRARATTEGVEVAFDGKLCAAFSTRVSYTYLDARNDETQAALARRPRHTGSADLRWQASKECQLGAGVHVTAARFNAGTRQEDYTTVRVYGSYDVTRALRLKARLENALDERYESVPGYPALPFGAFAGVEWTF